MKRRKQTSYGRNGGPVDREGCGVPQNGQNGPPTVETGVLFIGRGVAYLKTGLHTPPDEQDPVLTVGGPTEVRFLHFAVSQTPLDEQHLVSTVAG